jgi:thymidine phosphorylase
MTLHTDTPERFARAQEILAGCSSIVPGASGRAAEQQLILDRVTA